MNGVNCYHRPHNCGKRRVGVSKDVVSLIWVSSFSDVKMGKLHAVLKTKDTTFTSAC